VPTPLQPDQAPIGLPRSSWRNAASRMARLPGASSAARCPAARRDHRSRARRDPAEDRRQGKPDDADLKPACASTHRARRLQLTGRSRCVRKDPESQRRLASSSMGSSTFWSGRREWRAQRLRPSPVPPALCGQRQGSLEPGHLSELQAGRLPSPHRTPVLPLSPSPRTALRARRHSDPLRPTRVTCCGCPYPRARSRQNLPASAGGQADLRQASLILALNHLIWVSVCLGGTRYLIEQVLAGYRLDHLAQRQRSDVASWAIR
jgi:hypothetical protein